MSKPVRVRFAPSPSGALHIGNLRTALFNWLYARSHNGVFVLRIEDSDKARSNEISEEELIQSLKALGLDWDEGPDIGGPFGPYRQSMRKEKYQNALAALENAGYLYPCFCTPAQLESERKRMSASGKAPRYSGKCRNLSESDRAKAKAEGQKAALRFKVEAKIVSFVDGVHGIIKFNTADFGDFIVARSDGTSAFYLASLVDDIEMEITDVIRGEDHLSNTPKQILIAEALGNTAPKYHHIPLVMDSRGKKLSKREGGVVVAELLSARYRPEAILTATAMLGWSGVTGDHVESLAELSQKFDFTHISTSPARYDPDRLKNLNTKNLKSLSVAEFGEWFYPIFEIAGFPFDQIDDSSIRKIMAAVQDTMRSTEEAVIIAMQFVAWQEPDDAALLALKKDDAKKAVSALAVAIEQIGEWEENAYDHVVESVKRQTGLTGATLFMPIRAALTGRTKGPRLVDLFAVIKPEEAIERIEKTKRLWT